MEQILLLFFKTLLFVCEIIFGLWNRQKEKALNEHIIQRLNSLENEIKKLKS
jgi:hypothetical protein